MEVNSPAAVRRPDVEEMLEDPVTAEKRKGEVVHFAGDGKQMREGTIYINRIGKQLGRATEALRRGDEAEASLHLPFERRRGERLAEWATRAQAHLVELLKDVALRKWLAQVSRFERSKFSRRKRSVALCANWLSLRPLRAIAGASCVVHVFAGRFLRLHCDSRKAFADQAEIEKPHTSYQKPRFCKTSLLTNEGHRFFCKRGKHLEQDLSQPPKLFTDCFQAAPKGSHNAHRLASSIGVRCTFTIFTSASASSSFGSSATSASSSLLMLSSSR